MKKKTKIIASAAAVSALCASVIAGSTFALFTSESKVNIAVTSATVDVTATIGDVTTTGLNNVAMVEANVAGNSVELNNIAPGDKVSFNITVENKSSIEVKYRTKIECTEGGILMSALVFTVGESDYSGLVSYVSAWDTWENAGSYTIPVEIGLPEGVTNEYQGLSCKISYAVEAVQGNGDTVDESELIKTKVGNAAEFKSAWDYVTVHGGEIILTDNVNVDGWLYVNNDVKINLNGKTLVSDGTIVVNNNAALTVLNGRLETSNKAPLITGYVKAPNANTVVNFKSVEYVSTYSDGSSAVTMINATGSNEQINITDSTISLNGNNGYVLSTDNTTTVNPTVNIKDSVIDAYTETYANRNATGILFNVPGMLNISNSTVKGTKEGIIVRGSSAVISDSNVWAKSPAILAGIDNNYATSVDNNYNIILTSGNDTWGTGNSVPFGALIIGNHRDGSYNAPSNVTLINTKLSFEGPEGFNGYKGNNYDLTPIVIYGNSAEYPATLTYDAKSDVGHNIVKGPNTTVTKADLTIYSADDLFALANEVNGGNSYSKKTIILANDIDLENKEWTPIGNGEKTFRGTFDGLGHTISNLYVNKPGVSRVGLFGKTQDPAVLKNLSIENADITGQYYVGAFVGDAFNLKTASNLTLTGHVKINGCCYVGGVLGGDAYATVSNVTIDADATSYIYADSVVNGSAYATYVGSVIGQMGEGGMKVSNVTSNINVYGSTAFVGGIVGGLHYGNTLENCVYTGTITVGDDVEGVGGIAGVWVNTNDSYINNCTFAGTLPADFENNTVVGDVRFSNYNGTLYIDGEIWTGNN